MFSTDIAVKHIIAAKPKARCQQSTSMFYNQCFNLINRQKVFLPFSNGSSIVPVLIQQLALILVLVQIKSSRKVNCELIGAFASQTKFAIANMITNTWTELLRCKESSCFCGSLNTNWASIQFFTSSKGVVLKTWYQIESKSNSK